MDLLKSCYRIPEYLFIFLCQSIWFIDYCLDVRRINNIKQQLKKVSKWLAQHVTKARRDIITHWQLTETPPCLVCIPSSLSLKDFLSSLICYEHTACSKNLRRISVQYWSWSQWRSRCNNSSIWHLISSRHSRGSTYCLCVCVTITTVILFGAAVFLRVRHYSRAAEELLCDAASLSITL